MIFQTVTPEDDAQNVAVLEGVSRKTPAPGVGDSADCEIFALPLPKGYACSVSHVPAWRVTVTAPPGGGSAEREIPEGASTAVLACAIRECLAELGHGCICV